MDHRYKCKTEHEATSEENIGANLHDLELSKAFLDDTKSTSNKRRKVDKLNFIKILNFL